MRNLRKMNSPSREQEALLLALALGAAGLAFLAWKSQTKREVRTSDDAPHHTVRGQPSGPSAVTGRTVTIARPREELYAFWRDFANLPKFMENVHGVEVNGDRTRWTIAAPAGTEVTLETLIVEDRANEFISWRSTPESDIETTGSISFREAPGNRGTEVEADIAYVPPGGEIGRWIAKAFQAEPAMQGRRELKRLKMLMETGEIATNRNRRISA